MHFETVKVCAPSILKVHHTDYLPEESLARISFQITRMSRAHAAELKSLIRTSSKGPGDSTVSASSPLRLIRAFSWLIRAMSCAVSQTASTGINMTFYYVQNRDQSVYKGLSHPHQLLSAFELPSNCGENMAAAAGFTVETGGLEMVRTRNDGSMACSEAV